MPEEDSQQTGPETDTPLWQFALALWQQSAARDILLRLQEQGWSVTRLLCATWLASRGAPYSGDEPQALSQWHRDVTESIRSLKKSLDKSDSLLISLRESLASAELEAERIELYRAWLAIGQPDSADSSADVNRMAERNLRQAAPATTCVNETTEPMIRHLAQLIGATARGLSGQQGSEQA